MFQTKIHPSGNDDNDDDNNDGNDEHETQFSIGKLHNYHGNKELFSHH